MPDKPTIGIQWDGRNAAQMLHDNAKSEVMNIRPNVTKFSDAALTYRRVSQYGHDDAYRQATRSMHRTPRWVVPLLVAAAVIVIYYICDALLRHSN